MPLLAVGHQFFRRGSAQRSLVRWLMLVLLLLAAPVQAAQDNSAGKPLAPLSDDSLLIVQLWMQQSVLSDGMEVHQLDGEIFFPLGEFASNLSLAIQVDPEAGTASGFIINTERSFALDSTRQTVLRAGVSEDLAPELYRVGDFDIFVARSLLMQWFPVLLDIDLAGLIVDVTPTEVLPRQQSLAREEINARMLTPFATESTQFELVPSRHQLFSAPRLDQRITAEFRQGAIGTDVVASGSSMLTGDLLGFQAESFVEFGTSGASLSRTRLSRTSLDGTLLGPLHAREFAFGDIGLSGVPAIARSSPFGTGLVLNNYPTSRPDSFDTHSFAGELPVGWDVELFYNGQLIGYLQSNDERRYRFDELPLSYGTNRFRLVFRGPEGQLREERKQFLIGRALTAPGKFYYRVGARPNGDEGITAIGEFDIGLTKHLSGTAAVLEATVNGAEQRYASVGARALIPGAFLDARWVQSDSGGTAQRLAFTSRFGALGLRLTHTMLDDFISEEFANVSDPVRSSTELNMNALVDIAGAKFPVTAFVEHEKRESGRQLTSASLRSSTRWQGISVVNELIANRSQSSVALTGNAKFARSFTRFGLRGSVNYDISDAGIQDFLIAFDGRLRSGWVWSLSSSRSLIQDSMAFGLAFNRVFDRLSVGATLAADDNGNFSAGITTLFSATRDPRAQKFHFSALPAAEFGAVSARVFLDDNDNGVMDAGEMPLSDVGFTVGGARSKTKTGSDGTALIPTLQVDNRTALTVTPASLQDPALIARPGGVRIDPRPGHVQTLDFAVIRTGEIDGTVALKRTAGQRGMGNVLVQVVDAAAEVVSEARTAYDGFYVIAGIPFGEFTVRLAPGQSLLEGRADLPTRRIALSQKQDLLAGIDFTIGSERRAADIGVQREAQLALKPPVATQTAPGTEFKAGRTVTAKLPAGAGARQPATKADPPTKPRFALQAGAFLSRLNAERLAQQYRKVASAAATVPYRDSNGVRWYRVRVGAYPDRSAATAAAAALQQAHGAQSLKVMPLVAEGE